MQYEICFRIEDGQYAVWVPGLPGCWSQGDTKEEALANIEEAIRDYRAVAFELASKEEHETIEVV